MNPFNVESKKKKMNTTFNVSTSDRYQRTQVCSPFLCELWEFFFSVDANRQMTYGFHGRLLSVSLTFFRSHSKFRLIGMNTGTYVNTYRMLTPYL